MMKRSARTPNRHTGTGNHGAEITGVLTMYTLPTVSDTEIKKKTKTKKKNPDVDRGAK